MKTISLSVAEADYEAFREVARKEGRPIAQVIREAMAIYRAEHIDSRGRLESVPVLAGHRPVRSLPSRETIYDEITSERDRSEG